MIRHVVCHRYRDKVEAQKVSALLESLVGVVPSLRSMETGVDCTDSSRSYHLALIATFDDRAGLDAYLKHPAHEKVRDYIHTVLESSVSVDYEC